MATFGRASERLYWAAQEEPRDRSAQQRRLSWMYHTEVAHHVSVDHPYFASSA